MTVAVPQYNGHRLLPEAYLVSVVFLQLTGDCHPDRLCLLGFMVDVIELGTL